MGSRDGKFSRSQHAQIGAINVFIYVGGGGRPTLYLIGGRQTNIVPDTNLNMVQKFMEMLRRGARPVIRPTRESLPFIH
jgi:hypothetical protein